MKIRRGFSLLEALLALALTAMLAALVSSFLWTISSSKKSAQAAASELRSVGTFLDRLEDDLAACIAGGDGLGPGIVGSGSRLLVLSRGVGIPTDPEQGEKAAREQLSDLRGTEFALDGSGVILGRRWIGASGGGAATPVATGVAALRFRFYDGSVWSDSFDSSKAGTLPVAIEVGVWTLGHGPATLDDTSPTFPTSPTSPTSPTTSSSDPGAEPALGVSLRAPDRWRLITIPDGPVAGWKEGAS